MKFLLEFEVENAAFMHEVTDGDGVVSEFLDTEAVAAVVGNVAVRVSSRANTNAQTKCQTVHDANGNDVGRWSIK